MFTEDELIKKKDIFDPIEDDDDIDWKHNPFDVDSVDEPAAVEPMKIVIDEDKWRLPCNRAPPRKHSEEKQKEIRKQVDALLELGVIKESQATEWSQVLLLKANLRSGDSPLTLFD
jgi:hypothetical protein